MKTFLALATFAALTAVGVKHIADAERRAQRASAPQAIPVAQPTAPQPPPLVTALPAKPKSNIPPPPPGGTGPWYWTCGGFGCRPGAHPLYIGGVLNIPLETHLYVGPYDTPDAALAAYLASPGLHWGKN